MSESMQLTPAMYLTFLEELGDAVVVANRAGQVLFCNPQATRLLHGKPEILLHHEQIGHYQIMDAFCETITTDDLPFQQIFSGRQLIDLELSIVDNRVASTTWLLINGKLLGQKIPDTAILSIRDISLRKQQETNILEQALQDTLTGLPNRQAFMDRVTQTLHKSQTSPQPKMAILYIDLDHIKTINDNLGYSIGNQLITEVAQRLKQRIRPGDCLARLGGDEFAVLLTNIVSEKRAIGIAERLRESIIEPFYLQQHEVHIDASTGIALNSEQSSHPEDWLRNASLAMEQVKNIQGLHWQVFDYSSQLKEDQRFKTEIALRDAIVGNQLRLHYQPIVAINNQDIVGFEALVRWQHPEKGLLFPGDFIDIAETSGLIIPLGWWVLEEACRQMQLWAQKFPYTKNLSISINMSSKQFSQSSLVQGIRDILEQTGLSPNRLDIELTEGVLIEHSNSIITTLEELRSMGIRLSIDDFGTGYSSLSYLHQFPFDTLKIDRCFIENADQDFEKLEILQSVVRLAWNLGLNVVAEGIETQRHYAQLKALRCESGQGYLFSKPLAPESVENLLRDFTNKKQPDPNTG
jgi:diguanylate cyclase (GGDEF)-like protein